MDLYRWVLAATLLVGAPVVTFAEAESASCAAIREACATTCVRFKADVRFAACENFCVRNRPAMEGSAECVTRDAASAPVEPVEAPQATAPPTRVLTRKA